MFLKLRDQDTDTTVLVNSALIFKLEWNNSGCFTTISCGPHYEPNQVAYVIETPEEIMEMLDASDPVAHIAAITRLSTTLSELAKQLAGLLQPIIEQANVRPD